VFEQDNNTTNNVFKLKGSKEIFGQEKTNLRNAKQQQQYKKQKNGNRAVERRDRTMQRGKIR